MFLLISAWFGSACFASASSAFWSASSSCSFVIFPSSASFSICSILFAKSSSSGTLSRFATILSCPMIASTYAFSSASSMTAFSS